MGKSFSFPNFVNCNHDFSHVTVTADWKALVPSLAPSVFPGNCRAYGILHLLVALSHQERDGLHLIKKKQQNRETWVTFKECWAVPHSLEENGSNGVPWWSFQVMHAMSVSSLQRMSSTLQVTLPRPILNPGVPDQGAESHGHL